MRWIFGLLLTMTSMPFCAAEIGSLTLERYLRNKSAYGDYLTGVKEGILTSSAMTPKDARAFCIPPNLALTVEQATDILERYADLHKTGGDQLVSIILFAGLKETFPCPAKR